MPTDPDLLEAQVQAVYERVRTQLRELLHEGARALSPFPTAPGAIDTAGIEVEDGAAGTDRGCVILGEDGEFYELHVAVDADSLAAGANEPVLARQEQRVALELSAGEYVAYAQQALRRLVEELRRR